MDFVVRVRREFFTFPYTCVCGGQDCGQVSLGNNQSLFVCGDCGKVNITCEPVFVPHLCRRPPKPVWFYGDKPGRCTWCGESIIQGQRKNPNRCNWHIECLHEYRMLFDWPYARQIIFQRDRACCISCGSSLLARNYEGAVGRGETGAWLMPFNGESVQTLAFHVDHIKPLHQWEPRDYTALTQETFTDFYAPWMPENLQLLCPECHKHKTANERIY